MRNKHNIIITYFLVSHLIKYAKFKLKNIFFKKFYKFQFLIFCAIFWIFCIWL